MEGMALNPKISRKAKKQLFFYLTNGYLKPYGSECYEGYQSKIFSSLNSCGDGVTAVFAHGGILWSLKNLFTEERISIGNCGFLVFDFDDITEGGEFLGGFKGFS